MNETANVILTLFLWGIFIFMVILYLWKKCYVPYEPNKIRVIMYGSDYHSAMIGTRGYKIDPETRIINADPDNKPKRSLLGILPGILIFYPFFKVKNDIKLFITEKKHPSLIVRGVDVVLSENSNIAIVLREVTTDYILFENTYYFAFKELETGNDYLTTVDEKEKSLIDLKDIQDPEIEKFTKELNQLIQASMIIQGQIKDLENIDVEMVLGDVVQVTNVWEYLFQQKTWFSITETITKSAIREIAAEKSYGKLLTMQSATSEVVICKDNVEIPLAQHLTERQQALNLGHKSRAVMIEEFGLGVKSKEIEQAIEDVQKSKRELIKEFYTSIKKYVGLNLYSKQVAIAKKAIIDIKTTKDATAELKWKAINGVSSKITHFYEGGGSKDGGVDEIAHFSKILSLVDESTNKKAS